MKKRTLHGGLLRGLNTNPRSPSYEGSFGRMFRTIPAAKHSEKDLSELAKHMIAQEEDDPTSEDEIDNEENQGIDAGYTYLGQFIDHDLTFDPSSSLQKQNDPNGLVDFRTPRFDLDNVYGRGPDDQPYLYKADGKRMLLGRKLSGGDAGSRDLVRINPADTTDSSLDKRALIGDPRNDENVIVSQLQGIFLRFHNRMADIMPDEATFSEVQHEVRWHYQWIILNDFLPKIVGQKLMYAILPHLKSGKSILDDTPDLRFYHSKENNFMPVEFSVAAYRFGHSMVRPIYRLNTTLNDRQVLFDFTGIKQNLVGFREFPESWAINWDLFFDPGKAPIKGKDRIQKSYKIDTSLVDPLGKLPPSIGQNIPSLALRNLIRGMRMGLPSGQDVARFMGLQPIADKDLRIGKATKSDTNSNPTLMSIIPSFEDNAPLWYYILAEAQYSWFKGDDDNDPIHLGPVGGRIVAEVFIGLLLGDSHSYLSQYPNWKPNKNFLNKKKDFGIRELIDQALKAKE